MKIAVVSGSRADAGMLEWPLKVLREDPYFEVAEWRIWGVTADQAMGVVKSKLDEGHPDVVMLLGDRFEIMGAAWACHLERVPVAHLCGGDVTLGSYDDAMRDCISRMASIHFVTSTSAMARLTAMGLHNIHLVGSTGLDYIRHADWRKERPIADPYVVVTYYPETIDAGSHWGEVKRAIDGRLCHIILPNLDLGSVALSDEILEYGRENENVRTVSKSVDHAEFLNLIFHCEEMIGNSSAMIYEATELGVKTRMIGRRQQGRVLPWGDGNASKRIAKVLRYTHL